MGNQRLYNDVDDVVARNATHRARQAARAIGR